MNAYLGEISALATSFFWALTSTFFTLAGERVGSQTVNRVRLILATVFLAIAHFISQGTLFPVRAGLDRWGWLALSAVIGLVIGDGLLFYAFSQIGTRLSMLLMALAPVMGTIMAWIFLGEALPTTQILAISVAISGIAWVVFERNTPSTQEASAEAPAHTAKNYIVGVLCGVGAALGQAVGLVMSKQGMVGNFPSLSASLIRVLVAAVFIWIVAAFQREARESVVALQDRRAFGLITVGSLVGPTIGMTLSLVAVQFSEVGIASTLMALSPVMLIPIGHWIFKEQVSTRAVFGTGVAMAGVAMLFLL
ncbi:MAG: DMT family transporter [Anaerolineae bacterium]|nr:DMT family transporter [Anaerolineae bacterium]